MRAAVLLTELEAAGIHATRRADTVRVRAAPGVDITPYRERIVQHKPAILIELLQREILEAAAAVGEDFDRDAYDQLWRRWYALRDRARASAPASGHVSYGPIEASAPPTGWDGQRCAACSWPALCNVLGPRGPHLPGGPCAAWPAETAVEVSA
jgi:hypothetical protein